MFCCYLKSKIHGARITETNVDYRGSLSIDKELMSLSGIAAYEQVDVYNLENGERLTTYAIEGGSGEICLNGAAALRGSVGQRIIIAAYAWLDEEEAKGFKPPIVLVGEANTVKDVI